MNFERMVASERHFYIIDIGACVMLSCNSHSTALSDEHNLRLKREYNFSAVSRNGKPSCL